MTSVDHSRIYKEASARLDTMIDDVANLAIDLEESLLDMNLALEQVKRIRQSLKAAA